MLQLAALYMVFLFCFVFASVLPVLPIYLWDKSLLRDSWAKG